MAIYVDLANNVAKTTNKQIIIIIFIILFYQSILPSSTYLQNGIFCFVPKNFDFTLWMCKKPLFQIEQKLCRHSGHQTFIYTIVDSFCDENLHSIVTFPTLFCRYYFTFYSFCKLATPKTSFLDFDYWLKLS